MSTTAISFRRAASHNLLATIGVVLVLIFVIFALFAPWIAPQDPAHIDLPTRLTESAIALSVVSTSHVIADGESNWVEGMQLLAVYLILGLALYFVPAAE